MERWISAKIHHISYPCGFDSGQYKEGNSYLRVFKAITTTMVQKFARNWWILSLEISRGWIRGAALKTVGPTRGGKASSSPSKKN